MLENSILFNKDARFIILDTESEGLGLSSDRPFQLSWIVCSSSEILERHDKFIFWDDLNMSESAAKITKFDWAAYKQKAISPTQVYEEFSKYLFDKNNFIVCQNILNFDCYMIKNLQKFTYNKIDFSYLDRVIDTKVLFIAQQKNIKYDGNCPFLSWQYKVNSIVERGLKSSQQFMLNYFEIPHDKEKLHEAMYDISMLFEIFKKLIRNTEIPDLVHQKS